MFIQTLSSHCKFGASQKWEPAGPIGDFGNFNGFAKSSRVLRSSWILNECNLYCKIVNYCTLSEVCMMKTASHSTVSPQMWCIKSTKGWFTRPQICWQDFVQFKLVERQKFGLICFPRICFPGLIYCDQEPLWFLNVIEDDCYFLGAWHTRLSTRCKIWFTIGLFAN